jgi:molecular chaperone GrpE
MKDKKQEEAKVEAAETPADNAAADAGAEALAGGEKPAEPDWKALYAITLADFDNYKKRAARDREDVYRYAEADILKDVLPSVDNLALALDKAVDKDDPFVKGVQLVYDTLLAALAGHGAKPMDNPLGKELDPNFHEAIATLPDGKYEEGKISNIVKVGWMLGDKLLRAAQVVVSSGKNQ